MLVRASTFEALLRYLCRACECVSIGNAPVVASPATWTRPRVTLTFDDGWRDNFDIACPIARNHGVPLTIFICPGVIQFPSTPWTDVVVKLWRFAQRTGRNHIFLAQMERFCPEWERRSGLDALIEFLKKAAPEQRSKEISELESLLEYQHPDKRASGNEFLSWQQIHQMRNAGVSFGSHTQTHRILTTASLLEARVELQHSKIAIEDKLHECSLLAYPNGDWSESVREIAQSSGYKHAFANSPGIWGAQTDPLTIPRVNISEGKLTSRHGRFSQQAFEYAVFWKVYRCSRSNRGL